VRERERERERRGRGMGEAGSEMGRERKDEARREGCNAG